MYADEGDTDKNMTLLKFVADDEKQTEIGMVNWFAVHGTAMNNTNLLISGDNKGYASYLFEKQHNLMVYSPERVISWPPSRQRIWVMCLRIRVVRSVPTPESRAK